MDVIRSRQERRAGHIAKLKHTIIALKEKGEDVNKSRLILLTMSTLNLSKKTAVEYVEVALFELEE